MITPPFHIIVHAETDFEVKTASSPTILVPPRNTLFPTPPRGNTWSTFLVFGVLWALRAQFQFKHYPPVLSTEPMRLWLVRYSLYPCRVHFAPPLISKGVKKFKPKLSLAFRKMKAAQEGLPSLCSPGSNILRCQQKGFRPAKSGFRKLQKRVEHHGFKT